MIYISLAALMLSIIALFISLWDRFWGKPIIDFLLAEWGVLHIIHFKNNTNESRVSLNKAHLGLIITNKGPREGIIMNVEIKIKTMQGDYIKLKPRDFLDYKERNPKSRTIFHPIVIPKFGSIFEWIDFSTETNVKENNDLNLTPTNLKKELLTSGKFEIQMIAETSKKHILEKNGYFEFEFKKIQAEAEGNNCGYNIKYLSTN